MKQMFQLNLPPDVHELDEPKRLIIAILDEFSRRIAGWRLLEDQLSFSASIFHAETIQIVNEPVFVLWSAGRGELMSYRIDHGRTKPHNPQQNGKIERFWPTGEKAKAESERGDVIHEQSNPAQ
jgi:transposase InsO family protein